MKEIAKPNFFIVGAPKCGTTSIYHYLENHPQVFLSSPKEVNFFSKAELSDQNLYYQDFKAKSLVDYLNLFVNATSEHKMIGEASVSYLYYPLVPNRIFIFNPKSKIIIILRDPVKRAWSHYLMDKRLGFIKVDFMEAFYNTDNKYSLNFQQYFLLGNYYSQIKNYIEVFGRKNIKVLLLEELKNNTKVVIKELFEFLDIEQVPISGNEQHNVYKEANYKWTRKLYSTDVFRKGIKRIIPSRILNKIKKLTFNSTPPEMEEEWINVLKKYYFEEILQLESLISKDLTLWM